MDEITIHIASDHAGFAMKSYLVSRLEREGYTVIDMGPHEYDPDDDYPGLVAPVAQAVSDDPLMHRGIIIGGSGQGEAMVANRFPDVRAAVYYGEPKKARFSIFGSGHSDEDLDIIALSRRHNNANVLSLGARFLSNGEAAEAVMKWLEEPFSGDPRHERRIEDIEEYDET